MLFLSVRINIPRLGRGIFIYFVVLCAYANFRTSYKRIDGIIRTDAPLDETVTVRLWNTENMSENILLARLDKKQKICTFTHLSSRNRYAITVDNMPDISISVSSRLTFWEALSRALQNE